MKNYSRGTLNRVINAEDPCRISALESCMESLHIFSYLFTLKVNSTTFSFLGLLLSLHLWIVLFLVVCNVGVLSTVKKDNLFWMMDWRGWIGGEIVLTEETMVPSILMPDAPETGLGTEPAGQAFEMDMNNISSSLMKDVELSSGIENMTRELMQSVVERGSFSKRPVDKSMPSSSNNEAINAASTPVRCLEMEQEEPPLFDEGLG